MTLLWASWACLVALVLIAAAALEFSALRNRVNGANGLMIFMAGMVCLASLPVGAALTWYFAGAGAALLALTLVGGGGGLLFYALVMALDRYGKSRA